MLLRRLKRRAGKLACLAAARSHYVTCSSSVASGRGLSGLLWLVHYGMPLPYT